MTTKNVLLSMDTATGPCSAALWKGGKLAAYCENLNSTQQSSCLVPMVEQVMAEAGVGYSDLTAVISTVGPGSFTGIRVGLAAARGICLAANLPAKGYTTLETVAFGAKGEAGTKPILAVLNAGKGEVYYQAFAASPDWQALYEPRLGSLEAALASINSPAVVAGNMEIAAQGFTKAEVSFPRADVLAALASEQSHSSLDLSPFYIRPPDAKPMAVDR